MQAQKIVSGEGRVDHKLALLSKVLFEEGQSMDEWVKAFREFMGLRLTAEEFCSLNERLDVKLAALKRGHFSKEGENNG